MKKKKRSCFRTVWKDGSTFIHTGVAMKGFVGDAASILCDAVGMADLTTLFLQKNPNLFGDNTPVPAEWYMA